MQVKALALFAVAGWFGACKTGANSPTDAFTIGGDPAAAHQAIVNSVIATYPAIASNIVAINQFATALQDGNTVQAASSDHVLQLAYTKLNSKTANQPTEFDMYIATEFVAMTNYTTVLQAPSTALAFTGTPRN